MNSDDLLSVVVKFIVVTVILTAIVYVVKKLGLKVNVQEVKYLENK